MKTKREWIEQRARAYNQMADLQKRAATEKRALTEDENVQWGKWDAEFEEANGEITRMDQLEKRSSEMDREDRGEKKSVLPPDEAPNYEKVWRKWMLRGMHGLSQDERMTLAKGEQRGTNTLLAGDVATTYAGYLVPEGFSNELHQTLKAYGGMLQACRIFPTATGNNMQWPTLDDTTATGELTSEGGAVTVQDMTFSRKTFYAYNVTSTMVRVSLQLLQDEGVLFETELPRLLGTRQGRKLNAFFTTGTGSSQPTGVMAASGGSAAGVTAGATTVTRENIIDLIHSVDPAFLAAPGTKGFMFNNASLGYLKKLSIGSGDDRPLLYMGQNQSDPALLEGYPYFVNQDIASIATTAKSMAFGNWDYYIIRQVAPGNSVVRLEERFMDELEIGYFVWGRYDGKLIDTGAVKHLVHS